MSDNDYLLINCFLINYAGDTELLIKCLWALFHVVMSLCINFKNKFIETLLLINVDRTKSILFRNYPFGALEYITLDNKKYNTIDSVSFMRPQVQIWLWSTKIIGIFSSQNFIYCHIFHVIFYIFICIHK